ncbi:HAD family hydrolase [Candidatus Parcubacteria bacterium]|nr:MAG: HAD family hydrolase [Candidatus Parcubacteria bacterium]
MRLFGEQLDLVVLDVDGVLIDFIGMFPQHYETAAIRCGLSVEPFREHFAAVQRGERNHYSNAHESAYGLWPGISPEHVERLIAAFREEERKRPYPAVAGSTEAVHCLRKWGVPIALCTTNDRSALESRLRLAGMELSWFSAMSTWEAPHPKPDPRALDPIFERVPAARRHAVYLGDWYPDLQVARGAAVRFVAVLSGGIPSHVFLREGVPSDHILPKFPDLIGLIEP